MGRVTVKYLKEFIKDWPDDAYVYLSEGKKCCKLMACDSKKELTDDGYSTYKIYNFPEFPIMPLVSEDVVDYLNRQYETVEWLENNNNNG